MTKEEARQIIATWLVSSKGTKGQRGYIEGWFDEEDVEAFRMAIEALKERPTGKWIEITTKENEEMAFLGWVECSNCKSKVVLCSDFCPDCGADMRGEDDEKPTAWMPLPEGWKGEKDDD